MTDFKTPFRSVSLIPDKFIENGFIVLLYTNPKSLCEYYYMKGGYFFKRDIYTFPNPVISSKGYKFYLVDYIGRRDEKQKIYTEDGFPMGDLVPFILKWGKPDVAQISRKIIKAEEDNTNDNMFIYISCFY